MCILIAIVENVVFWTSTRTRFPSECVEILVPMILQHMLTIMSLALHFCWLACVSDMALLRISEKCVILNPPLHPTFTGWCEHLEYWPIFKVLIYDFRLWVSQHVSCTHLCSFQKPKKSVFKLTFLIRVSRKCSYIRVSRKFWRSTYTMLNSVTWNM